jgi:5-methylcytosine-specific restriction protein A
MIPQFVNRDHVVSAISEIRKGGVPRKREPSKFNLVFEGRLYPPKFVLAVAARHATGQVILPTDFSGDDEANSFLTQLGFEIQPKREDWSWKECYFAVWGYDQLDLDPTQIKSVLYRELSDLIGRTAKSVEYKLQNVSSFDLRPRNQKPVAEASNAQALLGEVFNWYWVDRLHARERYCEFKEEFEFNLESTVKKVTDKPSSPPTIVIEEGAASATSSSRRKRSQKLLEEGRKYFRSLDKEGNLRCEACGFVTPDGLDAEIIHLHHTEPIYDSGEEGRSIKLKDALALLVPLCPTCHAVAHTSRPPRSIESVKTVLGISPQSPSS